MQQQTKHSWIERHIEMLDRNAKYERVKERTNLNIVSLYTISASNNALKT